MRNVLSALAALLLGACTPMQWVKPEIAGNQNIFPDAEHFTRLQSLRDYDRRTRRLLNRLWVEVKVR